MSTSVMTKAELGRRIREARDARRISRETLAKMLQIREENVKAWEQGKYRPRMERLPQLCEILDIPMTDLLIP